MNVIVAGSRHITWYSRVVRAIQDSGFEITQIVSGGADGVDALAIQYAKDAHLPFIVFPADWKAHGRAAGPIRNAEMAEYADALIAIWDGKSRGTQDMIEKAKKQGLLTYVEYVGSSIPA